MRLCDYSLTPRAHKQESIIHNIPDRASDPWPSPDWHNPVGEVFVFVSPANTQSSYSM
jgi:hypothetical protein